MISLFLYFRAPVYGFGEDFVLGAGATLLTGLNKCFMSKSRNNRRQEKIYWLKKNG